MSKITLIDISSTLASSIIAAVNTNNAAITAAMEKALFTDGTSPNQMNADLDMNSRKVLNLPAASSSTEPVRKAEFDVALVAMETSVATAEAFATASSNSAALSASYSSSSQGYSVLAAASAASAASAVLSSTLTGISFASSALITAADTTLSAFGKLQAQSSLKMTASSNLSDLTNATTARLNLGLGPTTVASALSVELDAGERAASLLPTLSIDKKAVAIDLVNDGIYVRDDTADPVKTKFSNYPGVTITSSAGFCYRNRKAKYLAGAANVLQFTHLNDGTPAGDQIWPAITYLNGRTQPTVAQCTSSSNVTDAATPSGETGAWIQFGDNTVTRSAYPATISYSAATQYWQSVEVTMDDGAAPNPGTSNVLGDFLIAIQNWTATILNPDTGAAGYKIEGPFSSNKYIVSCYCTIPSASTTIYGVIKFTTQSARTFKLGRVWSGQGRYPAPCLDNATTTQNITRPADVRSAPLTGYVGDYYTVFGSFVCPQPALGAMTVAAVTDGGVSNYTWAFVDNLSRISFRHYIAGAPINVVTSTALTPGEIYYWGYSISPAGSVWRVVKASDLTLQSGTAAHSSAFTSIAFSQIQCGHIFGGSQLRASVPQLHIIDRPMTAVELKKWMGA